MLELRTIKQQSPNLISQFRTIRASLIFGFWTENGIFQSNGFSFFFLFILVEFEMDSKWIYKQLAGMPGFYLRAMFHNLWNRDRAVPVCIFQSRSCSSNNSNSNRNNPLRWRSKWRGPGKKNGRIIMFVYCWEIRSMMQLWMRCCCFKW